MHGCIRAGLRRARKYSIVLRSDRIFRAARYPSTNARLQSCSASAGPKIFDRGPIACSGSFDNHAQMQGCIRARLRRARKYSILLRYLIQGRLITQRKFTTTFVHGFSGPENIRLAYVPGCWFTIPPGSENSFRALCQDRGFARSQTYCCPGVSPKSRRIA